jgi:hypothetical protein
VTRSPRTAGPASSPRATGYRRPPRKRKAVALEAPAGGRHREKQPPPPCLGKAAAEVRLHTPVPTGKGAAQPSTPRERARDGEPGSGRGPPSPAGRRRWVVSSAKEHSMRRIATPASAGHGVGTHRERVPDRVSPAGPRPLLPDENLDPNGQVHDYPQRKPHMVAAHVWSSLEAPVRSS